jgi:hypothetical protein
MAQPRTPTAAHSAGIAAYLLAVLGTTEERMQAAGGRRHENVAVGHSDANACCYDRVMQTASATTKIVVHSAGGHDRPKLETATTPPPARGQVLVNVRAIGVNFADTIVRMGLYASAKQLIGWPITPGFEVLVLIP